MRYPRNEPTYSGPYEVKHTSKNHFMAYFPKRSTKTLTDGPDIYSLVFQNPVKLERIEWNFNDATAKDLDIKTKLPDVADQGYPNILVHLNDDVNEEGYSTFGDEYSYPSGTILDTVITGTADKLFSQTIFFMDMGE